MFCADSILFFLAPTTSIDSVNSVQTGANSLASSVPSPGQSLVWVTSIEQLGSVDWTRARKFFSWVGEKQFWG